MSANVLTFSRANPARIVIRSWINRNANDMEYLFFREFSNPRHDAYFQPFLQTDTLIIQFDCSFDTNVTAKLMNYYTGAQVETSGNLVGFEKIDNTTYQVYEYEYNISALDGRYYLEITGSDSGGQSFTAQSEPFQVYTAVCNAPLFEYYNYEAAFGVDYRTGITFNMRVPAYFDAVADETEIETYQDSGGAMGVVEANVTDQRVLKATEQLPQWVIQKVNRALAHDYCTINGVRVQAKTVWPFELIAKNYLWGEPEVVVPLASGYSNQLNVHDSATRETL